MNFKEIKNINERNDIYIKLSNKFPGRIPIICEPGLFNNNNNLSLIKYKFLVQHTMKMGQLIFMIRDRLQNLLPSDAIYLTSDTGIIFNSNETIDTIYNQYKDKDDNLLYMKYTKESTFGY